MAINDFNFPMAGCKVYALLLDNKESRDSDRVLLSEIWKKEIEEIKDNKNFLELFESGFISNPETICRIRRKLQEVHPSLRGDKWDSRHNMEGNVCQQLTFFDRW